MYVTRPNNALLQMYVLNFWDSVFPTAETTEKAISDRGLVRLYLPTYERCLPAPIWQTLRHLQHQNRLSLRHPSVRRRLRELRRRARLERVDRRACHCWPESHRHFTGSIIHQSAHRGNYNGLHRFLFGS
jgi:hypothetical protein